MFLVENKPLKTLMELLKINDMKKVLIFVFIGLVSCNSNDEKVQESQTNLSELVSIEKNEIPDISDYFVSGNKSSIQFEYDDDRESILNTTKNELRIPIKVKTMKNWESNESIKGKIDISKSKLPRICICIARTKPKTGCHSCVDCLGFRCKGCCEPVISQKKSDPRSRTQMAYISHDQKSSEIILKFGDVDWDYLANSDL